MELITKQRLEGDLRELLKLNKRLWFLKLQANPMAHTCMPADSIVLTKNFKYLLECKECKGQAFQFERWTQKEDMIEFQLKHTNNYSFIIICFWRGRKDKSEYYFITPESLIALQIAVNKKSANRTDFETHLTKLSYLELGKKIMELM